MIRARLYLWYQNRGGEASSSKTYQLLADYAVDAVNAHVRTGTVELHKPRRRCSCINLSQHVLRDDIAAGVAHGIFTDEAVALVALSACQLAGASEATIICASVGITSGVAGVVGVCQ